MMKNAKSQSQSLTNNPVSRPWLQAHYEAKRQRTASLVKATVDQIVKEGQVVTIEAICRKSIEMDDQGRGVKKSAILENVEAHAYYQKHSSSYQAMKQRNRKQRSKPSPVEPLHVFIDPNRNVTRVRYRYLQLTKGELVERLLSVEQSYTEVQQQLARLQFQLTEQEDQRLRKQ